MIKTLELRKGKHGAELIQEYNALKSHEKIMPLKHLLASKADHAVESIVNMVYNNQGESSVGKSKKYFEKTRNGYTMIMPTKHEVSSFKDYNTSEAIRNSISDGKSAEAMMIALSATEAYKDNNKIQNSIYSTAVGARDTIVRALAEPRKVAYGKYNDPVTGTMKDITLGMYVEENSAHSSARIDYGFDKITVADYRQNNAKFATQRAITATFDNKDNINNFLGDSATESAVIMACNMRVSTSMFEQTVVGRNMFFDTNFDVHQMKLEETKRQQRMFMETEIIKSFARQPSETSSMGFLSGILTPNASTIFNALSPTNFFTAIQLTKKYILDTKAKNSFYNDIELMPIGLDEWNLLAENKYTDLASLAGNVSALGGRIATYTRLNYLIDQMRDVGVEVVPAPFFSPNNIAGANNNTWYGINPYGNFPIMMLTPRNTNPSAPHALFKEIVPASIGSFNYSDFEGVRVNTSLSVFTHYKVLGGSSNRIVISTNA